MMKKKLIFVCSPFRGDIEENTILAQDICRYVFSKGHIPFAPHLIYPTMLDENDAIQRNMGIQAGLEILGRCDELWFYTKTGVPTEGMAMEIQKAVELRIPIRQIESLNERQSELCLKVQ